MFANCYVRENTRSADSIPRGSAWGNSSAGSVVEFKAKLKPGFDVHDIANEDKVRQTGGINKRNDADEAGEQAIAV